MAVRWVPAVAVVAAAAGVYVAVVRERRLRRTAVAARLMAGCVHRDVAALHGQLEEFRQRLPLRPPDGLESPGGRVAFLRDRVDPTEEEGF